MGEDGPMKIIYKSIVKVDRCRGREERPMKIL